MEAGTAGTTITNTAAISAADQLDLVTGNNEASVAITVRAADGFGLYLPIVLRH